MVGGYFYGLIPKWKINPDWAFIRIIVVGQYPLLYIFCKSLTIGYAEKKEWNNEIKLRIKLGIPIIGCSYILALFSNSHFYENFILYTLFLLYTMDKAISNKPIKVVKAEKMAKDITDDELNAYKEKEHNPYLTKRDMAYKKVSIMTPDKVNSL